MSDEEREVAKEFFLKTHAGQMILSCDGYVDYENNKWFMRNSDEQQSATIYMQSPVKLVHNNAVRENNRKKRYLATYLESGKLKMLERNTQVGLNDGQEQLISLEKESYTVDPADRLTWLQEFQEQEAGLVFSFTNTGTRAQRWETEFPLTPKVGVLL